MPYSYPHQLQVQLRLREGGGRSALLLPSPNTSSTTAHLEKDKSALYVCYKATSFHPLIFCLLPFICDISLKD
jgi:hypothetical protein